MALLVMLAIGVAELVGLIVGFSASTSLESALPDLDAEAPDPGGGALGPFSQVLGWLSVGRLPLLVLLVIFLTGFGLAGYALQWLAIRVLAAPIHPAVVAVPALVAGSYATRYVGRWLGSIFPRDHTEAASQAEMVGSYATIIRGEARRDAPAEAKSHDLRGRTHYILIAPEAEGEVFSAGQRVFIVGQQGSVYKAVSRLTTT